MSLDEIPHLPMTFDNNVQNGQRVTFQEKAHAVFFMQPEFRSHKSRTEGRPIYESVPYVRIIQPGERDTLVRAVTDADKMRFPRQWAAFQENRQQGASGTPLDSLFPHHPEVVATLKHLRIETVEQLAGLTDTQLQNVGLGGREWQKLAVNYIASTEKGKGFHELQAQLEARDRELVKMREMVEALEARVAASEVDGRVKRGRKAKEEEIEL